MTIIYLNKYNRTIWIIFINNLLGNNRISNATNKLLIWIKNQYLLGILIQIE